MEPAIASMPRGQRSTEGCRDLQDALWGVMQVDDAADRQERAAAGEEQGACRIARHHDHHPEGYSSRTRSPIESVRLIATDADLKGAMTVSSANAVHTAAAPNDDRPVEPDARSHLSDVRARSRMSATKASG